MSKSENSAFRKSIPKSIPPPPSFDSAPTFNTTSISIPSFSSAPDISTSEDRQQQQDRRYDYSSRYEEDRSRKRRERHPEDDHSSRRHNRSRSPTRHRSTRPRSRSPSDKRYSRKRRSRSPSHRLHHNSSSSKKRSDSTRHKESSKRRRRSRSVSPSSSEEPEVHTGTLDVGISFVMDTRGDNDNLIYGKNHAYAVPAYQRVKGGRILGFSPNIRIDYTQPKKPGQIAIVDITGNTKTASAPFGLKDLDKDFKRIHIRPKNDGKDPFAEHVDSIPLEDAEVQAAATSQQKQLLIDYDMYDSGVDYRSIEGNKVRKPTQNVQDGFAAEGRVEEGESFNEYTRRRTIEFNRQLDQEPHNVQLWLDFIQFQEEAAKGLDPQINGSSRSNKDVSANTSKRASLNEVKLSIFEKALEHNPDSEKLILAYLTCGAEIWETLQLLQTWDKYLKRLPDSIQLWSSYINLRQTNFASFTFTQCVNVFEDALSILTKQARITEQSDRRESIESLMVYILLRACLFMKQCGYQERAFAVIQAAVEFNLFQPSLYKTVAHNHTEKVRAFIDFWDSEVLRFGEKGARGWHEYYRAVSNDEDVPEPDVNSEEDNNEEEDDYPNLSDWLKAETNNEAKHRLPLRMIQADDELLGTDPFRVPLSDDVRNFLFDITTSGARHGLIYSVLVFLGLPYTPPEIGSNTHFFTDTFTRNDISLKHFWPDDSKSMSSKQIVWYVAGVPMISQNTVTETNPYNIPNSYPVGVSEMFAKYGEWFRCSGRENVHFGDDEAFTREVFQQLLTVEDSNHLRICYLAFEASCGHKTGRRLAKTLLKQHHTNLPLWNAYACMETSYGRLDEARKVYMTAIAMFHNQESQQLHLPLLYYMLAKLEFDSHRPTEALKILTCMSGNQPYDEKTPQVTTPVVLRTREFYSQKLVQLSTLSDIYAERQAAINLTRCCALFEYLSSGLDGACSIYEQAVKHVSDYKAERGYESELIWIDYATLVHKHAKNATDRSGQSSEDFYKPARLRHLLERALVLFPNNTIFVAFYIWNESRTKIYNRVQQLLNDALRRDPNVVLWLAAIHSEVHRYKPYRVDLVRDFFERAVENPRTRASIVLWKLYVEFEMMQNNQERAKTLFYRAIRECPWSKELYLQGIELLGTAMDTREKNELVNVMMEKEIRIRIPIEEHLLE